MNFSTLLTIPVTSDKGNGGLHWAFSSKNTWYLSKEIQGNYIHTIVMATDSDGKNLKLLAKEIRRFLPEEEPPNL